MNQIAIVGMGCLYPDAKNPQELWENAVSGRRAFRRIPDMRTSLADYHDPNPTTPDKFYADHAAVLGNYEFDRLAFKIAGSTYRSTDLTHWLALDVASRALADAGFPDGKELPHNRTGVVVGNTLTGEFSRANLMRLRWPYVRRVVVAELRELGWDDDALTTFVDDLEDRYKAPFPAIDEDTLAGGLANTIAGRICNYFDLHGGGYTVDGACSSSLLSVTTAARSLVDGDLDVAIAGGVDLSIDPFEIVGFAKTGALARTEMRLYDEGSNGFWPGEGCGMVVLMREEDARATGRVPLARLAGWGISSDGAGGMTRPELAGYQLALDRAYDQAGFGIDTVPYFEGHGTGTPVGDDLELSAISKARRDAGATDSAAIGSVKAQIGHTKAAAGIAGLIKAVQTVRHGVVPPTIGCRRPHARFLEDEARVRPIPIAEPWPEGAPLRAGVTSMGFGGINTHVVLEGDPHADQMVSWRDRPDVQALAASRHDAELLVFAAETEAALAQRLRDAAETARTVSYAELTDCAIGWSRAALGPVRAAVVATSPREAVARLERLAERLEDDSVGLDDVNDSVIIDVAGAGHVGRASADAPARVGLLFPGQGTGSHLQGGALAHHLPEAARHYGYATTEALADPIATQHAQPLTVLGSLAGLAALEHLGVHATAATGHSLGELCALVWAGSLDADSLVELATVRGRTMAEHSLPGTMATLDAPVATVEDLLPGSDEVSIAAENSPRHTVVAGSVAMVEKLLADGEAVGISGRRLPVSHAFHSELVRPAADVLARLLDDLELGALSLNEEQAVISTVSGAQLPPDDASMPGLAEHLCRQIVERVRFADAVAGVAESSDLLVEVGPGSSMARLAEANDIEVPVVSLDTDDSGLSSYLTVAAATWVGGAMPDLAVLTGGRYHREPPSPDQSFLANPIETADADGLPARVIQEPVEEGHSTSLTNDVGVLGLLTSMAAERAELPVEAVGADSHMLEDLHLSSITVGQIVARVADSIGVPDFGKLNLATSTIGELADGLEALRETTPPVRGGDPLGAVGDFIGTWAEEYVPEPLRARRPTAPTSGRPTGANGWLVRGPDVAEASTRWVEALGEDPSGGMLILLPTNPDRQELRTAFEAAKEAASLAASARVVIVGGHDTTTALAKTLFLEHPELRVTVLDGDGSIDPTVVAEEVAATDDFVHARYLAGERHVPRLVPHPLSPAGPTASITEQPVLLAAGGAKGITAECALEWARRLDARVALVGRSAASDEEVAMTVRRFGEAGIDVQYFQADLAAAGVARVVVEQVVARLGQVTHLLHGAGRNEPAALENLTWGDVEDTFSPKVEALENLLAAIAASGGTSALQHLVTFGSVIGRAGLWGEAHYAMANAELARMTHAHGELHPSCQSTCLEWSVWSEVGMGARLGADESLAAVGINAVPPKDGTEVFLRSVGQSTPSTLMVCGRIDSLPTVRTCTEELPLGRFLERVRRHHPGFELVSDAVLSLSSDPYLVDHQIDGEHVLPAVIGLEAMAQAASAVAGLSGPVRIADVRLNRPVVVPGNGELVVRLSAHRHVDGSVETVLLSEESEYSVAHFTARFEYDQEPMRDGSSPALEQGPWRLSSPTISVDIDPDSDLYGGILFQSGRFQRVRSYDVLSSTQVRCRVAADHDVEWFTGVLPGGLVLGDPGVRDALMHGNQVSVPDATLLPQQIDLIEVLDPEPHGDRVFVARETRHEGSSHIYDIDVYDNRDVLVERWRNLHLRAVGYSTPDQWPTALLGPHLERVLADTGVVAAVEVSTQDGSVQVSSQVEEGSCIVRCSPTGEGQVGPVLRELTGMALGQDSEPIDLGVTRGVRRLALGAAQAISAEAVTADGTTSSIVLAWQLDRIESNVEVVA